MRIFAKILLVGAIAGAGATMYAAPGVGGDGTGPNAARAARIRSETQADFGHVVRLQQIARHQKDLLKLNCVNDKLIQIKAQMNVADRLELELQSEATDSIGTYETLVQTGNAIHSLRESADECIGQQVLSTESTNAWSHPDIPDNPGADTWGTGEIEPPAYASPVN